MAKFKLKKGLVNTYLPKKFYFTQDLTVRYDPSILHFSCNQCGRCCDLRKSSRVDDNIVLYLTDLDIKKLQKIKISSSLKNIYPNMDNLAYFARAGHLKHTHEDVALIEKHDGCCRFFERKTNQCLIYHHRPLVCRVYPFITGQTSPKSALIQVAFDREKLLCNTECFQQSIDQLNISDLGKIVIYNLILHYRKENGLKYVTAVIDKLIRDKQTNHTYQSFTESYKPFSEQISTGNPDSNDEYYLQCQNEELIFFKTWTYCNKNSEILNKIQSVYQKDKNHNKTNPPNRSAEVISVSLPITIIEFIFAFQNDIQGVMIMLRIPPVIYSNGFAQLSARELYQLKPMKQKNEPVSPFARKFLSLMKFTVEIVDLDLSMDDLC